MLHLRRLYLSNKNILCNVSRLEETLSLNKLCVRKSSALRPDGGFQVDDRTGGPGHPEPEEYMKLVTKKQLRIVKKNLKQEFQIWKEEWRERLKCDHSLFSPPGEIYKIFKFSTEEEIKKWPVISDSSENTGYSTCSFTRSASGNALFSGNLCLKVPDDGKTYRAGFCAVNCPKARKSFGRRAQFEDWVTHTHLVFKVRGDGRSFMVNLGIEGEFDLEWFNAYTYPLYTRGGPYWQFSKIPFSKFIFNHRGYVQDTQGPVNLGLVTSIGFAISDDIEGPFQLEIDYIGLVNDLSHTEEHRYEAYNPNPYMCENK